MREAEARAALVEAARRLDAAGLNHNATGNVSVRVPRGILITPTGIPAPALVPEDGVVMDAEGRPLDAGPRVPSSEWRLHLALYRRHDVGAVVHTHSVEAASVAALGKAVPAVHYVVARFGGTTLPCAPYATYGSVELADGVAATLGDDGRACLMANHGAVTTGADLRSAISLACDVEWLCGVYRRARQLGDPVVLDDAELVRVADRFRGYGQPR